MKLTFQIKPLTAKERRKIRTPSSLVFRKRIYFVQGIMAFVCLVACVLLSGCAGFREWYKACPLTPDGLNYTQSIDRKTGDIADYFGASWQCK